MTASPILTMGRLASPHGIKGWLKVQSFTTPIENILHYQPWKVFISNHWEILAIEATHISGNRITVKIEGCTTPEEARQYTGLVIGIESDQLPILPKGEYYWSQLVGLRVVTVEGIDLGVVDHLLETGSNDVLVIKGEKTRLVPYLPDRVIQSIDLLSKKIVVDWDPDF